MLWVGRIAPVKRLELLVDVAPACPDVEFTIAGKPDGDPSYASGVLRQLQDMPNVNYIGAVARGDMPQLYQKATVLLCTSAYEGFPNTFLEAWSHGVPVISTVDPGDLLSKQGLGVACIHSANSVIDAVRSMQASVSRWQDASGMARDYFCRMHGIGSAMPRFEAAFAGVIGGREG